MSNNNIEEWLKAAEKEYATAKPKLKTKQVRTQKQKPGYLYPASVLAVVLVGIVIYFLFVRTDAKQVVKGAPFRKEPTLFDMEKKQVAPAVSRQADRAGEDLPMVRSVKLIPAEPVSTDTVRAEAALNYQDAGKVTYRYQWKVNAKDIEGAQEDSLPPGPFKKNDKVSVRIVPSVDGKEGYPYESMFVLVRNAPPTLELKEKKQKLGDVIEFQLAAADPDNDKVTFALEEPLMEGMTIDKETGLVSLKLKNREKGMFRFRASATDTDSAKVAKTFEFAVESR